MEGAIYVRTIGLGNSSPLQGQKEGDLFQALSCTSSEEVSYLPSYSVSMGKVRIAASDEVTLWKKGFKNISPFKVGDEVIVRQDSRLFSTQRANGKQTVDKVSKGHMPIHTAEGYCYHIEDLELFKHSTTELRTFQKGDRVIVRKDSKFADQRQRYGMQIIKTVNSGCSMPIETIKGVLYNHVDLEFYKGSDIQDKIASDSQFKVGDRVIVRKDSKKYSSQREFGVQIISNLDTYNYISTDKGRIYKSSDLEIYSDISESPSSKTTGESPFKVGDEVIVRKGGHHSAQRELYGKQVISFIYSDKDKYQVETNKNSYSYEHLELYKDSGFEKKVHRFKVGDRVTIVETGSGVGPKDKGKIVTITEIGEYGSFSLGPGYKISPALGNTLSGDYNGFIGEDAFEFYLGVKETMSAAGVDKKGRDTLLAEANERYPIGTKVNCLVLNEPATTLGNCRMGDFGCIYAKVEGNETKLYDFDSGNWARVLTSTPKYLDRDGLAAVDTFTYPLHYSKRIAIPNPCIEISKEKPEGTGLFNVPRI